MQVKRFKNISKILIVATLVLLLVSVRAFEVQIFYDPFYDPFFYNHANIVRYPERTVSFQNGRAIAFQFLPAPRFY